MSDIDILIFSKERTLQLKSLLMSLMAFSEAGLDDICVLYQASEEIEYQRLTEQFPCRFVRQDAFYDDVMTLMVDSSREFVCFMVDDLIFRESFSWAKIQEVMHKNRNLDCFSLRLGRNIRDGKEPEFDRIETDMISWETAKGLGKVWNYFWELSSSVYRKSLVLDYLRKCSPDEISYPNPMESKYYVKRPSFLGGISNSWWSIVGAGKRKNRMACYQRSRCFTIGVNRVAKRNAPDDGYVTSARLHKRFLDGYHIDFKCLSDINNTKPNTGTMYFRLIGPNGEVDALSVY